MYDALLRSRRLTTWLPLLAAMLISSVSLAAEPPYVSHEATEGRFALAEGGVPIPIHIGEEDYPGVIRAVRDLQVDFQRVTHSEPALAVGGAPVAQDQIIVGTLGRSPVIDRLVQEGRLDVSEVEGRRETYLLQVVENPAPGVDRALVIAGSDKRGTIFGIYDLSEQIGVSPWYYWADVPTEHRENLYVLPGRRTAGEPVVRYRGIFLNNENPALLGWVNHTFGGFGHEFYEHVFELILRLRGNYLWPAMWGKAFYDDDPLNAPRADLYGVVIGTTHHEPMGRSHIEWARYGEGSWDYERNTETLQQFWRTALRRLEGYESTITLGMRGDGDEEMSPEREVSLMQRILAEQRQIIAEELGDPTAKTQIWALYKEVQEYYEQGLRPPDDVMILLANDNWGNVRLLPSPDDPHHAGGGYGMYYHFDYVGGPRNYKWINTIQAARTWEQMHMTWQHGVDRMWLVNVGDLKPMEFPITFFLDMAWNPAEMPLERMAQYSEEWAERVFGPEFSEEIGFLLSEYTRFNSRRKPELLDWETYSLVNYREFERVVEDYNALAERARRLRQQLPAELDDAYYQLVMYPVEASANLNELYYTVARNHLYAEQGRAATNALAERARELFDRDQELADYYNYEMSDGKWRHMMDETRIGYTTWQSPPENIMPPLREIDVPQEASLGVAVPGMREAWPASAEALVLPELDGYSRRSHYIELFNRGQEPARYTVRSAGPYVGVSRAHGTVHDTKRVWVAVDWYGLPEGRHEVPITIEAEGQEAVTVTAVLYQPGSRQVRGFVEVDGYVAMEAASYERAVDAAGSYWREIPGLGRTRSGMRTYPAVAESAAPGEGPRLEYAVNLREPGEVTVHAYLSPTLNYDGGDGLRYGVSFNDGPIQVVNMHNPDGQRNAQGEVFTTQEWYEWVADNIIVRASSHTIDAPGPQVLKFWMIDPGVVLQRLVIDTGGLRESYLGPPESYRGR